MQNLKIKVNTAEESKEVQELLFEMDFQWRGLKNPFDLFYPTSMDNYYIVLTKGSKEMQIAGAFRDGLGAWKETTLAEFRDMVKPVKEYLNTETYRYKLAHTKPDGDWVEIPEGAIEARLTPSGSINFINSDSDYMNRVTGGEWVSTRRFKHDDAGHKIIWQRPTQPEALPFIDDEPKIETASGYQLDIVGQNTYGSRSRENGESDTSYRQYLMNLKIDQSKSLNDQYAEIEQVRQLLKDNVNHPSHYTQGKVECIDAIESATVGKTGIDAVCVANVIKYLWRYEDKGGLESILKAKWYLDKLIECKK